MKIYYQTVTTCDDSRVNDEWIVYEGYDLKEATAKREHENEYCGADYTTEVRAYRLPDERDFEELDDDEQCAVLSCYDVIE